MFYQGAANFASQQILLIDSWAKFAACSWININQEAANTSKFCQPIAWAGLSDSGCCARSLQEAKNNK